ncbi:hypothetical protein C7405_101698 [Paraburkholderia caballeronis]|uniref:hypothetical protein n=1 Tax=Paraburkholderia caballeronis TaxID=416943 RepID=UPI001064EACC|nr:hypothetical protein [Paraburkholderia caballeronis]TDV39579.1 hypothetical protein C7405_101698 [Paraburkholderia caballeronis]
MAGNNVTDLAKRLRNFAGIQLRDCREAALLIEQQDAVIQQFSATLESLRNQVEDLKRNAPKDAKRYRWLREQSSDPSVVPRIEATRWTELDESVNEGEGLRMEALDAAIDALPQSHSNGEAG